MRDDQTTENISRAEVDSAMAHLGIFNPKPEIPVETTITGHEIVAISRRLGHLEQQLYEIRGSLGLVE